MLYWDLGFEIFVQGKYASCWALQPQFLCYRFLCTFSLFGKKWQVAHCQESSSNKPRLAKKVDENSRVYNAERASMVLTTMDDWIEWIWIGWHLLTTFILLSVVVTRRLKGRKKFKLANLGPKTEEPFEHFIHFYPFMRSSSKIWMKLRWVGRKDFQREWCHQLTYYSIQGIGTPSWVIAYDQRCGKLTHITLNSVRARTRDLMTDCWTLWYRHPMH